MGNIQRGRGRRPTLEGEQAGKNVRFCHSELPNTELSLRAHTLCSRLLYAGHTSLHPQDGHDTEGLLGSPAEEAEAPQR